MADVFDFYVKDNRTIQFNLTEPIMLEDSHVSDWVFHIPRVLNNIDMSGWAWWLVYINARGQKYSELLTLSEDPESPLEKCIATYTVDYSMSIRAGVVRFSLEAINADTQGTILNEWHTQTYQAKVQDTLQGNQVEFAETESDIISALIIEVQNKVAQLVGGATPEPVSLIADMTDTKKVYLYVGSETGESTNYWYYYNGSAWVAGGLYASGIAVDAVPTQGSSNAVSSGGVWDALQSAGLSEAAKSALLTCFRYVAWTDEHGRNYYDALESTLYPATGLVRIEATFTQGSTTIYEDDELNDLKAYLVVTGYYNDGTSRTETDYALIGELTEGTSIITVSKDQKTTTFNVTVSPPYWDYKWDASSGVLPEGMTTYRYNFTEEPGALYVENPVLDFDYIGDCRLMVECKWYCFNEDLTTSEFIEEVLWGNNPQLFALNKVDGNQKTGSRVIGHASISGSGRDMRFLAGQSETSYGYKDNVYRIYDLTANGNEYSIVLPDDSFSVSGSGLTSQYNQHTGIYSEYPPTTKNNKRTITALFIKSIKFKKF